jgi:hypothetical protein
LSTDIVLIIHILDIVSGMSFGLLSINVIQTLGLSELVDFSTGNTSEEFLGELMGDWLA